MSIKLNYNKNIILVDSSYYVFYRFFATTKWFNMQKNTEDLDFTKAFLKHIQADINKIIKKFKTDKSNIIFCEDCPRSKIWRNDLFKDYKASRQLNQNFDQTVFYTFSQFIIDNNFNKICLDRLEADDIVSIIHNKIKNNAKKITIITNDNDYLQLLNDNTDIINMQFKNIKFRTNFETGTANLFYKAIIGDKSDNISKLSNTINKDLALKISNYNEDEIKKFLVERNLYDKFLFNLKLISFEYIPDEYIQNFNDIYIFE